MQVACKWPNLDREAEQQHALDGSVPKIGVSGRIAPNLTTDNQKRRSILRKGPVFPAPRTLTIVPPVAGVGDECLIAAALIDVPAWHCGCA